MRTRNKAIVVWAIIIAVIGIGLLTFGGRTEYTFRLKTFPPGTRPEEKGWEYMLSVHVYSNKSPITRKSTKEVRIMVYDNDYNSDKYLLKDMYEYESASINSNIKWDTFEEIQIELIEEGNSYSDDPYNKRLVKRGPKILEVLKYRYDKETGKFHPTPDPDKP